MKQFTVITIQAQFLIKADSAEIDEATGHILFLLNDPLRVIASFAMGSFVGYVNHEFLI